MKKQENPSWKQAKSWLEMIREQSTLPDSLLLQVDIILAEVENLLQGRRSIMDTTRYVMVSMSLIENVSQFSLGHSRLNMAHPLKFKLLDWKVEKPGHFTYSEYVDKIGQFASVLQTTIHRRLVAYLNQYASQEVTQPIATVIEELENASEGTQIITTPQWHALLSAYPKLNLAWVLLGVGFPTLSIELPSNLPLPDSYRIKESITHACDELVQLDQKAQAMVAANKVIRKPVEGQTLARYITFLFWLSVGAKEDTPTCTE